MIKKFLILLFISSLTNACSLAQTPSQYANLIGEQSSKEHLTILSSREYEGRGTGQKGGEKTAQYIAEHFKTYGLQPVVNGSYFQPVALKQISYKVEGFSIGEQGLVNGKDFFASGDNDFQQISADEIIFVGYGIQDEKYNEIQSIDIKDKVILLLNEGEPTDASGKSLLTGSMDQSEWSKNRFKRIQELLKHNPKMILATGPQAQETIHLTNDRNLLGRVQLRTDTAPPKRSITSLPTVFITEEVANSILAKKNTSLAQFTSSANTKPLAPLTIALPVHGKMGILIEELNDPNVLGLVEGTDLKDEIVVVCGHYDHDGILPDGTFFPGADDNGSGTVAILELAKVFAKAKQDGKGPRRSMLFIGLAAEEKGLLGSKYYAENPILPLEKTVACINIDMIGRIDDKHLKGNHNYIHVIGANKLSSDLKPIVENANKEIGMELDYSYDRPNEPMRLYYRSDHYNFAKKGIPSLFFFSGLHPHYHTPEDTVDKIDFPMMVKREKLIFHTAWDIATRDDRPKVDIREDIGTR